MTPADVVALFHHLYFVRDRVLDAADDPAVPLVGSSARTLRDLRSTFVHELDVEWSWRVRLAADDRTRFNEDDDELDPADFDSVAQIRARWQAEEAEMLRWLATLTDADLAGPCRTEAGAGRHPFWFHLQHLYSHGLQQLADAATILTAAGRSPGELDFLEWVEQRLDRGRSSADVRPAAGGADEAWAAEVLATELSGRLQARRGELIDVLDGDVLIAWRGSDRVGVLTWRPDGPGRIEITSLLAVEPGGGIGSALLAAVADVARNAGARSICVTTTNDNLTALGLYQRRGYKLVDLRAGAVENARRSLKPGIPETAANGLPLRDELELELELDLRP